MELMAGYLDGVKARLLGWSQSPVTWMALKPGYLEGVKTKVTWMELKPGYMDGVKARLPGWS